MNKKQIAITLGLMCLILTFGIVLQLNTIQDAISTVGQSRKENKLRDEVLKWKEKYDTTYSELQNAEKQLEKERQVSISNDSSSVEKQEKLKELKTYLGLTDVVGEGIIITVQDNTASKLVTSKDVIHDGDLRAIVNYLKNAGAEAISINGQRITPSTSITCAGTVIQINDEAIGNPFTIKAIGDQARLYYNMTMPGSYLYYMKNEDGMPVDVKKEDEITIEKYNGVLTDKYIQNAQ